MQSVATNTIRLAYRILEDLSTDQQYTDFA